MKALVALLSGGGLRLPERRGTRATGGAPRRLGFVYHAKAIPGGGIDVPLTLAEEYLLLALDDDKGSFAAWVGHGLAGAMLVDLIDRGRLALEGKTVTVVETAATGDDALDQALALLAAAHRPQTLATWVLQLAARGEFRQALTDRLVGAGVLRREEHRFLRIFPYSRYPEQQHGPEGEIIARLRSVLLAGAEMDVRAAALIALLDSSFLLRAVVDDAERNSARERIAEARDRAVVGDAIAAALDECASATTAAIVVCTS